MNVTGNYSFTRLGGLVGGNGGTITAGYWDTETSGVLTGIGLDGNAQTVTGDTTAQLQSGTLPSGFDNTVWGTGSGLYPYFLWQYPTAGGTPQAISGVAYSNSGSTPLNAGTVSFLVDGNALGNGIDRPQRILLFARSAGHDFERRLGCSRL